MRKGIKIISAKVVSGSSLPRASHLNGYVWFAETEAFDILRMHMSLPLTFDTWQEAQSDMNNFLETLGETRHLSL